MLRVGSCEQAREKATAQEAIDRKQLELMFKTELLSSYSDMEEHIETELKEFREHIESDDLLDKLDQKLAVRREEGAPEAGSAAAIEARLAALEKSLEANAKEQAAVKEDLASSTVLLCVAM